MPTSTAAAASTRPESRALNLTLELKDPTQMPQLVKLIREREDDTRARLRDLRLIHFACFVPIRGNTQLLLVTQYDGAMRSYLLDFVIVLDDLFNAILSFIKDAPPLPVRNHPEAFVRFIERNDRVIVAPPPFPPQTDHSRFCPYPRATVLDLLGQYEREQRPFDPLPVENPVDSNDIQGNILRGYRARRIRFYALRINDAAQARRFFEALADGNREAGVPAVTRDSDWGSQRPACAVNVALTATGLAALGLPLAVQERFPQSFREGPAHPERAHANGDIRAPRAQASASDPLGARASAGDAPGAPVQGAGDQLSHPDNWSLGNPAQRVDVLLSLADLGHDTSACFESTDRALRAVWRSGLSSVHEQDTESDLAPFPKTVFGYRDGIGQPRINGVASKALADHQPQTRVGEFLAGRGYRDIFGGPSLRDLPAALCENSTFAVIRVMKQALDPETFEEWLKQASKGYDEAGKPYQVSREFIAAKIMGRWRDGRPLTDPREPEDCADPNDTREPGPAHGTNPDDTHWNAFDFAPTQPFPAHVDDFYGAICPVGSHVRRMNPRGSRSAGKPYSRRIIRRGMPYRTCDSSAAGGSADAPETGLFGLFYCRDIDRQFEFLLQEWGLGDRGATGIEGTTDPFLGAGTDFRIPRQGAAAIRLTIPRLVQTRGSLYLFVPGINGLRRLARGAPFDDLLEEMAAYDSEHASAGPTAAAGAARAGAGEPFQT